MLGAAICAADTDPPKPAREALVDDVEKPVARGQETGVRGQDSGVRKQDDADHTDEDRAADVVDVPAEVTPRITPRSAPNASVETNIDEDLIHEKSKAVKEKAKDPEKQNNSAPNAAPPSEKTAPEKSPPKPEKSALKPLETAPPPSRAVDTQLALPSKITEPGYATVLSGTLQANTELSPDSLPHLIRGMLVVPAKITLKINAGTIVHLRADPSANKPLLASSPDPCKSAVIWVYGTLLVCGDGSRPVEFAGQEKDNAQVLLYGGEQSKLEGARFRGADIAQNGGVCHWTNCEFNDAKFYALAAGAGLFTHCSFKKCGGVFAAYDEGPWALLVRRCLFENCRDGLLINRDPGPACLLVEKNNFIGTRGANLRAMPRGGAANSKNAEEVLIGENWYGTTVEEEIDRRIVDRRTDAGIKAHLNTRSPAEKAYTNVGAGAPASVIATSLSDQQAATAKMLQTLAAKQKPAAEKSKVALEKAGLTRENTKKETQASR